MALSTTREFGVRHVVNATAPNPEQESQGTREDWANELYGTVASYAALPASGNWPGRRRWVTDLNMEFTWDGSDWLWSGGVKPYAMAGLADTPTLDGNNRNLPYSALVRQSSNGIVGDTGGFVAPIPGVYRFDMGLRVGSGADIEFWLRTQQAAATNYVNRGTGHTAGGHLRAVSHVFLGKDEWVRWAALRLSGSGNTTPFATGSYAEFEFISSK